MGYYAVLVPPFIGHLNPGTVLARALQRRGHRVAFLSPPDAEGRARGEGLEYIPIAQTEFPLGDWERTTLRMGELSGLTAGRYAGRWIARLARGIIKDLPSLAARERFDGLVMDQTCIGAEGVCEVIDLPLAVACCALPFHCESGVPPPIFPWRYGRSLACHVRNLVGYAIHNSTGIPLLRVVSPYRRRHRLGLMKMNHINVLPPSLVQVAQQPARFDFPRQHLPPYFHYTSPWVESVSGEAPDFPWEKLDGRPLIYASLGTLQNRQRQVFRVIAEACVGREAQLVLALGNKSASIPTDLPGGPLVVGYAPQQALLKRASLVITHGGLNTTLESLREGLPLVVLPITNDQPGVAARLAHLGLGVFIPVKAVTATRLRALIDHVLATPSYRERAATFAAEIRPADGAARAAELIEAAFVSRQRVCRPVS